MSDKTLRDAILPCPFCGSPGLPGREWDWHWVRCGGCGVQTPAAAFAAEAVTHWNRRAALAADEASPAVTFDVEAMLRACVPGGSIVDPQQVCDDIRAYCAALAAEQPEQREAVAVVSECEACMTPDVCQLRGTCDHYAAERLRVAKAAPPQPARHDVAHAEAVVAKADAHPLTAMAMQCEAAAQQPAQFGDPAQKDSAAKLAPNSQPAKGEAVPDDGRCPECWDASTPGWKRGWPCTTCKGSGRTAQRAAVPQWVPLATQWPERFQPVLLIAATSVTGLTPAVGDWNGREWQAWPYSADPTHWLPLPAAPQPGGEGER